MRYREDKQESIKLLRRALPLMGRQSAALHPVSYSLWYEHVAGLNPPLSKALTTRINGNEPLNEQDVYMLHARYISARDVKHLEGLQAQLRGLLEQAARHATLAGTQTRRFGQKLELGRSQLNGGISLEGIEYVIGQLVTETSQMQGVATALSQDLEARAHEVRVLSEQLQVAQTEALLDPLSGLYNRRGFEREMRLMFGPEGGLDGAALIITDIDHFKRVNDTYGHVLGDKVLQTIARTLRDNIKGRDIAARIGGEEFAILLPQTTLQGAQVLAEQLRTAVAQGRIHADNEPGVIGSVTISIGIAIASGGETFEALMSRADGALYQAKREGRNRVCIALQPGE